MKRFVMLAAMLSMVLVAAAPSLAQEVEAGQYSQVAFNDCEQVLDQAAYQVNVPEADVSGDENEVAQGGTGVDAEQVQYCVNLLAGGFNEVEVSEESSGEEASAEAEASAGSSEESSSGEEESGEESGSSEGGEEESGEEESGEEESGEEELPETGGLGLLSLGAGALLITGGLVARRVVR